MKSNFINNYIKNKFYIILILLIGFVFSIIFYSNIKIHYKGSAVLKMSYLESHSLFKDEKILIYPMKGHNIFLIEKLFKDLQLKRISINQECYNGSVFDDSNEFSVRRKQLGFSPGFDFKISRIEFELTIEYRDSKNIIEKCINSFIEGFNIYQNKIYDKHILSHQNLYETLYESNEFFFDFATKYAKKYNLKKYEKYYFSGEISDEIKEEIENSGANYEIALLYFKLINDHFKNKSFYESNFERSYQKIIQPIKVESLRTQKFLILLVINIISFISTFIFVIIKEYDH